MTAMVHQNSWLLQVMPQKIKPIAPSHIPEWRMNKVYAVIENIAPFADEVSVVRASLPSTVSRNVMAHAASKAQAHIGRKETKRRPPPS